jgi:hypothetical protein
VPEELLDFIKAKGREAAQAIAVLPSMKRAEGGRSE